MGFIVKLIDKDNSIREDEFATAIKELKPEFNSDIKEKSGVFIHLDSNEIELKNGVVKIFGSFTTMGDEIEGLILNLLLNLQKFGYKIEVICPELGYES